MSDQPRVIVRDAGPTVVRAQQVVVQVRAGAGGSGGGSSSSGVQFTQGNVVLGRSSSTAGPGQEIACTAMGRSIIAAASGAAVIAAIGITTLAGYGITDAYAKAGLTQGSVIFAGAGDTLAQDNANFFYDATNHRLGVKTATPSYPLDVNGEINMGAAGWLRQGGIALLRYNELTGLVGNNLALGKNAGNIDAAGSNAGLGNNGNVAIGTDALSVNNTIGCTAVGFQALKNNIGDAALAGIGNTAVGQQCLFNNTTGNNNAAFGRQTAFNITTGSGNLAIGNAALLSLTTGSSNVAIGTNAMVFCGGAAAGNFAMGSNSLRGCSGSNNIAIGANSSRGITTGSNNIYIGAANNGTTQGAVTTGASNIMIGNDSMVPTATASQQLSIGNLIYGFVLDGTGATVSSGRIVIGSSTDDGANRLQVSGAATVSGNTGIGGSPTSRFSVAGGSAQFKGLSNPSAGAGVEIGYTGTVGIIQCYDRDASAYKDINIGVGSTTTMGATVIASLTCTATTTIAGIRLTVSDAANTIWQSVSNAGMGITTNGGALTLGGGVSRADITLPNSGDISIVPNGGVLKFGTHTAIGAEALSGYITIKDSGGTSRKLAVIS